MNDLFLEREQLERLTGRRTRPAQIRQLRERKIPYEVNALGQVLVARAYVERRLGVQPVEPARDASAFPEPDFSIFGGA